MGERNLTHREEGGKLRKCPGVDLAGGYRVSPRRLARQ